MSDMAKALSIVELKALCIELGIIKPNPRDENEVPMVHCSLNKLYELILRIT
jgi:hypothetical protein